MPQKANLVGNVRLGVRVGLIALLLLPALVMHALWGVLRIPSPWPRFFLFATAHICGIMVKTSGKRVRSDVFYVSNHVGWFDIPIIAGTTGCAFVAQEPIRDWPVIGWLARRNYTVFVSRTDRLGIGGQIETLRWALAERTPVTIFPEGTTTDGRSLLPFKPGLFEVVVPPPKPMQVQPVALHFNDVGSKLAWVCHETAPENALRVFRNSRLIQVEVEFLEPFTPESVGDRKAISARARSQIATALETRLGRPLNSNKRFIPPYPDPVADEAEAIG